VSTRTTRNNWRRPAQVWLAVAALLLQTLVPLGQGIAVPVGAGAERTLVVCSAYGTKRIPNPNQPKPADRSACPICQVYAFGKTATPTSTLAVPVPVAAVFAAYPSLPVSRWVGRTPRPGSARSPPLV